jgi:uncharacterized protein (DUF433 family)
LIQWRQRGSLQQVVAGKQIISGKPVIRATQIAST